jgi:hypothetical protein
VRRSGEYGRDGGGRKSDGGKARGLGDGSEVERAVERE